MAARQHAEYLGLGVAAVLSISLWGGSASVRALLVAVAGVALLDVLTPVWRTPARSKCQEEEKSEKDSGSFFAAVFASGAASMSVALKTVSAAYSTLSDQSAASASFRVLVGCTLALLCMCIVRNLGIPGYPWNGLVLGSLLSWCFRQSGVLEQADNMCCPCGYHDLSDVDCPYHTEFWKEFETSSASSEEVSHEPPSKQSPSFGAIATIAESVSAAFTTVVAACGAMLFLFQVFGVCVAGLLTLCTVKALGLPGYPWNGLVLVGAISLFIRYFYPADEAEDERRDDSKCPCGVDDCNDDACPYSSDFWKEFAEPSEEEKEDEPRYNPHHADFWQDFTQSSKDKHPGDSRCSHSHELTDAACVEFLTEIASTQQEEEEVDPWC